MPYVSRKNGVTVDPQASCVLREGQEILYRGSPAVIVNIYEKKVDVTLMGNDVFCTAILFAGELSFPRFVD